MGGDLSYRERFALTEELDDLHARRVSHSLGDRCHPFAGEGLGINRRVVVETRRRGFEFHVGERIKVSQVGSGAKRPFIVDTPNPNGSTTGLARPRSPSSLGLMTLSFIDEVRLTSPS